MANRDILVLWNGVVFDMLDKDVPYAGIIMRRPADVRTDSFPLPEGFGFTFYKPGDEESWAKIETSVLEFDSEFEALMYFKEKFVPRGKELSSRCLFIETGGKKVATATAWGDVIQGVRRPWLHWVAVMPEYQGRGLGKALVSRVTELMTELDGRADFFLSTQTWSYKAIDIYKTHGYEPTNEKILYTNRKNNYKKAVRILKKLEKKRRRA